MKMFILKIHTDYGCEGQDDYSLVVSPTKERLEELANDFLGKLSKIKKKIALDTAEWEYEDDLARKSGRRAGDIARFKAPEKIRDDVWLSFQEDSALNFLEIKENWSEGCSKFNIEEVEVV